MEKLLLMQYLKEIHRFALHSIKTLLHRRLHNITSGICGPEDTPFGCPKDSIRIRERLSELALEAQY